MSKKIRYIVNNIIHDSNPNKEFKIPSIMESGGGFVTRYIDFIKAYMNFDLRSKVDKDTVRHLLLNYNKIDESEIDLYVNEIIESNDILCIDLSIELSKYFCDKYINN